MNKPIIWAKLPQKEGYISLYYGVEKIADFWAKEYTVEKDSTLGKFRMIINNANIFLFVDLIKDFKGEILYTNQIKGGK